jgi:hypothetical protein
MLLQRWQTSSGTNPALISREKTRHPAHHPKAASRKANEAKTISSMLVASQY